jgi:subtilisin family serine protease
MIDTAVDDHLAALDPQHIRQRSFIPPGTAAADPGHGTAIAAILAGRPARQGSGLLPGVGLRVAQIFTQDGSGHDAADALSFAAALDWLASEKVPVVNLSLAGHDNLLIQLAVERASAQGMLLVAAAGNGGPSADPAYPAAYPGVLAVAALDAKRNPDQRGNRGDYVAFAAPGDQVWSPSADGGQYNSGSSFAAPFVAAALTAQLMAGSPTDRGALEKRLAAAAIDLGPPGRDPVFGWGLLQARPPCASTSAALK